MAGDKIEGPKEFAEMYLSTLPSMRFYSDLEKNYEDLSNYSQKCEKIILKIDNDEARTICKKFLSHLENSTVWVFENLHYDVCLLLNYWIYERLNNIYSDKEATDIAFSNFQLMSDYPTQYIRKNISFNKKCKYKIDVHAHKDWNKRKEFYDYCVDYDTLNGSITSYANKCNDFYEYIEKKDKLYKYFQNICSTESNECPKFYQECKDRDPNLLLSQLPCREEMVRKKAVAEPQDLPQEQESGINSLGSGISGLEAGSHAASTQEKSDIGTKVGHSVLGVAPVLLTVTALYR
ncbi:PIR Superfamily Protein, partial [Plasmodium ovale curtisi]